MDKLGYETQEIPPEGRDDGICLTLHALLITVIPRAYLFSVSS